MHEHIRKRCIRLGELLIETRETVRVLAKMTGYSKSTVHKDLTERLPTIHEGLAEQVKEILAYHKPYVIFAEERQRKTSGKKRASQE